VTTPWHAPQENQQRKKRLRRNKGGLSDSFSYIFHFKIFFNSFQQGWEMSRKKARWM
jgi:hypothetical protein